MKKAIIVFAVLAIWVIGNFIYTKFTEGDFIDHVIEGKPTLIILFDESKRESSTYKTVGKNSAYIGDKYESHVSIIWYSAQQDYYEPFLKEIGREDLTNPSTILLNSKGDLISVYEGSFPVEKVEDDLVQLLPKW